VLQYPYLDGQPVTYHGTVVELHGRPLLASLCPCRGGHPVEAPRFILRDPAGREVARHVNPHNLNPA
jgi:hypothetical protein